MWQIGSASCSGLLQRCCTDHNHIRNRPISHIWIWASRENPRSLYFVLSSHPYIYWLGKLGSHIWRESTWERVTMANKQISQMGLPKSIANVFAARNVFTAKVTNLTTFNNLFGYRIVSYFIFPQNLLMLLLNIKHPNSPVALDTVLFYP